MGRYYDRQRARSPILPHSSVDRQRNDRLGRKDEHYLAKRRRQILRHCTESDTHANTFSDPNRDSYAHGDRYSDGNGHAEVSTDAASAPDSGTSTVMP